MSLDGVNICLIRNVFVDSCSSVMQGLTVETANSHGTERRNVTAHVALSIKPCLLIPSVNDWIHKFHEQVRICGNPILRLTERPHQPSRHCKLCLHDVNSMNETLSLSRTRIK